MEKVVHNDEVLAIIIRSDYHTDGIQFFTPNSYSQQLAYMNRPAGYTIEAHTHRPVSREVAYTLETLFIRSGKVKIDFYTSNQEFVEDRILTTGDVVLLVAGGHGFTMIEPTEMIEVKQGPFLGPEDKVRFGDSQ